jgi:hypothetical protein
MTTYRTNKVYFHNKSCEIKWNQRILELIAYKDEHGDCNVPKNFPENKALGLWVATKRKQYQMKEQGQHSQLTEGRVIKLGSIDFTWKLREQSGQQGKESKLTNDNIAELDSMGFLWSLQDRKPKQTRTKMEDACFEQRVQDLKAYRDTNGHCRVPAQYKPNKALGSWVNTVRTQYTRRGQGKKTSLTDTRISELESLGFVWKARTKKEKVLVGDELWKKRVEELEEYLDTNGHCRVPFLYEPNKALGWWVNNLRTQNKWHVQGKKTPLTDTRISELDSLGFVWKASTKKKEGLVGNELREKGEQNISGISASQEKPLNSIDQDAATPNRTISPPSVPLQGAPRNVFPQSSTAMLQTNNHITFNPSSASNAAFKDSKKFSCEDGMEEMFQAMRAEEKRREDEELRPRQNNTERCRKPNTVWIL